MPDTQEDWKDLSKASRHDPVAHANAQRYKKLIDKGEVDDSNFLAELARKSTIPAQQG
jgi:hypothetical protein